MFSRNMGTSINVYFTAHQRTSPQWEICFFFSPSTLKIAFLNDNLNHRRTRTGHFVCKIWALFSIFKKGQGRPTPTPQPQYVSRLYTHEKILYAKKLKFET